MAKTWTMQEKLTEIINHGQSPREKGAALMLSVEFARLVKQKCGYCDGFGHSGKDCPTDHKIANLRGGVAEQNKVLQQLRKECHVASGMANVRGFSLLSADPNKTRLGKRKRSKHNDNLSADDASHRSRLGL